MQRTATPIHALCIQEATLPQATLSIAQALGRRFTVAAHASAPRLAIAYDRTLLRLRGLRVLALPQLDHFPSWQKLYSAGGPSERKFTLVGRFDWRGLGQQCARQLTIANFHLDAAGDNAHRVLQLRALSRALDTWRDRRLVACGDTNAFSFDAREAERALACMLSSLRSRHGAADAHATIGRDLPPTHFFARADEPKLGHRIAVAVGRLGVDFPRRYDVVAAAPRVTAAGVLSTIGSSDHDLVWAQIRSGPASLVDPRHRLVQPSRHQSSLRTWMDRIAGWRDA